MGEDHVLNVDLRVN